MARDFDIQSITDSHLKILYENKKKLKDIEMILQCEAEFARRSIKIKGQGPSKFLKDLEDRVATQLLNLGLSLQEKFDLSEERAKSDSRGTVGFRAHTILGRIGGRPAAKTGGPQKNGEAQLDRYISYRRKNRFASLNFVLENGKDSHDSYWLLCGLGNKGYVFDGGIAFVPSAQSVHSWAREHGGIKFENFEEAASAFATLLSEFAPLKS
jgi:hypothetical protein